MTILVLFRWILLIQVYGFVSKLRTKHRIPSLIFLEFPLMLLASLLMPWKFLQLRKLSPAEKLCSLFQDLSPIAIKFGQSLSTRPDLIGYEQAQVLKKLRDDLESIPFAWIEACLKKEWEVASLQEKILSIETQAYATASIAQVHKAKLSSGEEVAIKIVKPEIDKLIKRHMRVISLIARIVSWFLSRPDLLKLKEVVEDFETTLKNEQNMLFEAANASLQKQHFSNSDLLYVPQVYWSHTTPKVLVTEFIYGEAIDNIQAHKQKNLDLKILAEKGIQIFFTQVFENGFFHADMHGGNIFVNNLSSPQNPQYVGVDFGIMGSLSQRDKYLVGANLLAFLQRDYKKIAKLHILSGWVKAESNEAQLEQSFRAICEPFFGQALEKISFGVFLLRLFEVGRNFDMQVQPQLILLQKTLVHVEGLGKQLYPQLDLWQIGKSFLEGWVQRQQNPLNRLSNLWGNRVYAKILLDNSFEDIADGIKTLKSLKDAQNKPRKGIKTKVFVLAFVGGVSGSVLAILGFVFAVSLF